VKHSYPLTNECLSWCDLNCLVCDKIGVCNECIKGYFLEKDTLNGDKCLQKIIIEAKLKEVAAPFLFLLTFTTYWKDYMENIASRTSISLGDTAQKNCEFRNNEKSENEFFLYCPFEIMESRILKLTFGAFPMTTTTCCELVREFVSINISQTNERLCLKNETSGINK
jgi:hypothetical protein